MTQIKICGLFRSCDIDYVNEAKPDYIGFILNFPKSHRNLSPEQAAELKSRLLPDSELKPVVCTVCRVTERKNGMFDYGCQFTELDAAAEDEISKAILQLQMKRIRR